MKKALALFAMSAIATSSFAEIKSNAVEKEVQKEKKSYERVVVYESMANREGKEYTANITLTGAKFSTAGTSVEFGKHLDLNTVVSLQYTRFSPYQVEEEDEYDEYMNKDGEGEAINLNLKKFNGNSFYIKPGVYYRTQKKINVTDESYSSALDKWIVTDYEATEFRDIGVEFSIGNQWQWENFTLGTDWVGITKSVNILEQDGNKKLNPNDISEFNILNFYLGYTF